MDDLEAKYMGTVFIRFKMFLWNCLLCDTEDICRWVDDSKNKPVTESDFQETLQQIVFTAVEDYIVGL